MANKLASVWRELLAGCAKSGARGDRPTRLRPFVSSASGPVCLTLYEVEMFVAESIS